MDNAAMRCGGTFARRPRKASHAERHQSSASCSYQLAAGRLNGIALRPSPTATPSRVQATAFVAVVLLSKPMTRSALNLLLHEPRHLRPCSNCPAFAGVTSVQGIT